MSRYTMRLCFALACTLLAPDKAIAQQDKCIQKRYLFDVGSSTTKAAEYSVDICKGEILSKAAYNLKQHYQYCMVHHKEDSKGLLPAKCLRRGIQVLQDIQKHYGISCREAPCFALATAWARNTSNISKWLDGVKELGIGTKVLSQDDEAIFAYKAAITDKAILAMDTEARQDLVFLDVGGGSFQIVWEDLDGGNKAYKIHKSQYGTDNFTQAVIKKVSSYQEEIHDDRFSKVVILDDKELEEANQFAESKVSESFIKDEVIQSKLKRKIKLVTNSMLFRLGVRQQLGLDKPIVSRQELQDIALSMSGLTLHEVREKYPKLPKDIVFSTQSSMMLLCAIMKNLGVDEIQILDTDVLDYIAVAMCADSTFFSNVNSCQIN